MHRLSQWTPRQCYAQLGRTALRGHARTFWQAQKSFSTSRDLGKENGDNFEVRWFEQSGRGKETIKALEVDKQNELLKAKVEKLERELLQLRADESPDWLSAEEKDKLREELESSKADGGIPKELDIDDMVSNLTKNLQVELRLPDAQTESLQKLNGLLREALSKSFEPKRAKLLWHQYSICRQQSPGFERQLPSGAWALLWKSQYDSPPSELRAKHLSVLVEDMHQAGQLLNAHQKMMRIESLLAGYRHSAALEMWHDERIELENNEDVAELFHHLGPRLEALVGHPKDAERLAFQISGTRDPPRISLFIPVIEAWLRQGTDTGLKRAWACYLQVRKIMGPNISPEDYDQLVLSFLNGGHIELALGVFKDLVLAGRNSSYDSTELYRTSTSLYSEILDRGQNSDGLNKISLTALAILPRRFQNKFFYASWMKRLIGMGEIEAAASVLELMYHRGVRPDPKHINGLMSAWFRRGRKKDRELAINVGWAMIKERLNFVAIRQALGNSQPLPPDIEDPTASLPPYLGRALPAATIETFSILLLYYSRANMTLSVQRLRDTLSSAELQPNAYFLNHLLYNHLRSGDPAAAWDLYCTATGPPSSLSPDLETFSCLWDASKAHLATHSPGPGQKFPGPRALYSHMANWLSSLSSISATSPHSFAAAKNSFSEELHTQIIRCFCLARDIPGTLAALYSLREFFGACPSAHAIRLVSIQVARSGEPLMSLRGADRVTGKKFRRRAARFSDNRQSQAHLAKVAEVLEILEKERWAVLDKAGIRKEELTDEMKGEENLWLLGAFLQEIIKSRVGSGAEGSESESGEHDGAVAASNMGALVKDRIEKVAWDMGVGGLRLGAPMYARSPGGELRIQAWEGEEGGEGAY